MVSYYGMKRPCVYILASDRNGTLYVGVTSDLVRRIWEHRADAVDGFTRQYRAHRLVYFELHETMPEAILREKRIKKWRRVITPNGASFTMVSSSDGAPSFPRMRES